MLRCLPGSVTIADVSASILIVDDEEKMGRIIAMALEREGHLCRTYTSGENALADLDSDVDVVISDLKMPGIDGLELLRRVRAAGSSPPVILITAHGTVSTAVAAMRDGAFDYITKPFDNDDLRAVVARAIEMNRLRNENRNLRDDIGRRYARTNIIAESTQMKGLLDLLQRVAPSKATVLVQGESGTGKELVARLLHYWSDRVGAPFVAVNCKAFAESLLETELFGHEKGAFTGAVGERAGCFERAAGGTLFLDEIGEITPDFQAKLLRVLQEGEVLRVGANEPRVVKTRVVAATNRDLREEVAAGRFREDLFFRLNVIPIELAPLRDRAADIDPLARYFLDMYCREEGRSLRLSESSVEALAQHRWPGNVRELENAIERAVVLATGDEISPDDLLLEAQRPDSESNATQSNDPTTVGATLREHLDQATTECIRSALARANGSRVDAAQALGIERTTLYRMMKKFDLD